MDCITKWKIATFGLGTMGLYTVGIVLMTVHIGLSSTAHGTNDFDKVPSSDFQQYSVLDRDTLRRSVREIQSRRNTINPGSRTNISTASSTVSPVTGINTATLLGLKQLPVNASRKHPVSLLYELQLEPTFDVEHCSLHRKRVTVQSFKANVTLEKTNTTYGPVYGRNKKEAKKKVAETALFQLYNLIFERPVQQHREHLAIHAQSCDG